MSKGGKQPKKKNGYQMPDPIKVGTVLKDTAKKSWLLGETVGKGGFGEIYSACELTGSSPKTTAKAYKYAVKVEPIENGPLFVEQSVFLKCCKKDFLEEWKKEKGLSFLGIPTLCGIGTYEQNGKKFRFLVMEKYGKDVWKKFLEQQKHLSTTFIINCALQLLDALEYLHSKEYVHADIKGANLLFSLKKGEENNIYLLDYGISSKVSNEQIFKRNPKCAHNGTIEYISRDMHLGVPTRRSDLECLGYNLLHWFTSTLPWESIKDCDAVFAAKTEFMDKLKTIKMSNTLEIPAVLNDYMTYVCKLGHLDKPDYSHCKSMFEKALKEEAKIIENKKSTPAANSKGKAKKKSVNGGKMTDEEDNSDSVKPKPVVKRGRKAKVSETPPLRKKSTPRKKKTWRDAPALDSPSPKGKRKSISPKDMDDDKDGDEESPPKVKKGRGKKAAEEKVGVSSSKKVTRKRGSSNTEETGAKSWRDCSTVVNGNVIRPGVYKRKAK